MGLLVQSQAVAANMVQNGDFSLPAGDTQNVAPSFWEWNTTNGADQLNPAHWDYGVTGGKAYINNVYIGGSFSQVLSATLEPSTTYTLTADVSWPGAEPSLKAWDVELLAGSTVLSAFSSTNPDLSFASASGLATRVFVTPSSVTSGRTSGCPACRLQHWQTGELRQRDPSGIADANASVVGIGYGLGCR